MARRGHSFIFIAVRGIRAEWPFRTFPFGDALCPTRTELGPGFLLQDPAIDPWMHFLEHETSTLGRFLGTLDPDTLRKVLIEMSHEHFTWPQRVHFRGLVVARPVLDLSDDVEERFAEFGDGPQVFLEVVPERYPAEAYALTGGFVFPCSRALEPGSVVSVTLDVGDPAANEMKYRGILSRAATFSAEVAVER